MTKASKDFEWARERLKRAQKNPNVYNENRKDYLLTVASKKNGDKAVKELKKEFKIDS